MELKELLVEGLNPDELIDILGLSTEELVELLWDEIDAKRDRFYFLYQAEDDIHLGW